MKWCHITKMKLCHLTKLVGILILTIPKLLFQVSFNFILNLSYIFISSIVLIPLHHIVKHASQSYFYLNNPLNRTSTWKQNLTLPSRWSLIFWALRSNSTEKSVPEFPAVISEGSGPMMSLSKSSSCPDADKALTPCKCGGRQGPITLSAFVTLDELLPFGKHGPIKSVSGSLSSECLDFAKEGGSDGPINDKLLCDFDWEADDMSFLALEVEDPWDDRRCGGSEGPMQAVSSSLASEVESDCRWGGMWGPILFMTSRSHSGEDICFRSSCCWFVFVVLLLNPTGI